MSKFITILSVREGREGEWLLNSVLLYQSEESGTFQVPLDFNTDLASIPRLFRLFFAVNGKHRKAATLHDYLYRTGLVSRKQADLLFLEAMEACGVGKIKQYMMYAAVRAGGASSYKGNK